MRLLTHIKKGAARAGIIHRLREEQPMKCRKSLALTAATYVAAVCAAAVIPSATYAAKGHCPGNQHWKCTTYATSQENGAWYDAKTGQWYNKSCSCQDNSGSGSYQGPGSYGHAEIHKTNVPTVKPSGVGPTNLARPPLGIAPRATTPTFQPR